jgi:murein hydrolase activator|tara:strand:- start:7850 stop:9229 length:1380 start_codon:yes stop_codon:yes gene_type:complete
VRDVLHRALAPLLVAVALTAPAISPLSAETAEPGELEKLQKEISTSLERQKELKAQADAARAEAEEIRKKLISTAARVQEHEADVTASEERLQGLKGAEAVLTAQLEKRRTEMADLLAALTRLDRHPPPALAVRPDDALASIRSALLLGTLVPELQAEAKELRDRLEQLAALREEIVTERDVLSGAEASLDKERRELQALLDQKLAVQQKFARQAESEEQRAARLSRQATDLSDLIARLESRAAERLPATRPEPRHDPRPGPHPGPIEEPVRKPGRSEYPPEAKPGEPRQVAILRPPSTSPSMPSSRRFSDARGLIRPPVTGTVIRDYGTREGGAMTQGITIATRADAQIVAPFDGKVSYAGPFRHYGQLLIISVGEGYHVLLAGMTRIDCTVGQNILAGEPVGMMGPPPARDDPAAQDRLAARDETGRGPALYIEFRKDGDPIDPGPWLLMSDKKARG